MNASQVSAVRTELGIDYYPDQCNPTFTLHFHDTRMWSYTVLDASNENGPQQIIPMNREKASGDIVTPEELKSELIVRGYLD